MLFNFLKERVELLHKGSTLIPREDLEHKINIFFTLNIVTESQFTELINLLNPITEVIEEVVTETPTI